MHLSFTDFYYQWLSPPQPNLQYILIPILKLPFNKEYDLNVFKNRSLEILERC